MSQKLKNIDSKKVQAAVNLECRTVSEKTIHNAYGLIKSVMSEYAPDVHIDIKLPQKKKYDAQFLSPDQIKTLIQAIKGDDAELGILLALWLGMRRSEIIGLQWKNYDPIKKTLRITQALVPDKDEKYVLKPPKTTESEREIILPDYICRMLDNIPHNSDDEYIIKIAGSTIWKHLNRICAENGLPHIRVHDLRHTSASIDLLLGTPQKYAMQRGGWSNPQTMQKIYQHTFSDAMEESARRYNDFFQKLTEE